MKKILSIALALCMMLSICVVSVGAADGSTLDFVMGDASAAAGATVTIDLNVTSNPGVWGFNVDFSFDPDALTLKGISTTTNMAILPNLNLGAGKARASCDVPVGNYTGTGVLLTLTFVVAEDAVGDYTVTADIDPLNTPIDWDDNDIAYTMDGEGTISVVPPYPFTGSNIALGEKFAINVNYNATSKDVITVTSAGEAVDYTAADGVITIANIDAKNIDEVFDVTINGYTESFSVADYCNYQIENSADAELVDLAESVLLYNKAAKNYFEDAGETITVPACDVGTDNPRVVANSTTGGPTFYSVRLQLNDGANVVVRMKDYTDEAITVTIGGVAAEYTVVDVNGMPGVLIPVDPDQYDDAIEIAVGDSALTYSVNTYIQQKQTSKDAALVNLVNALGLYGQAVEAYIAA